MNDKTFITFSSLEDFVDSVLYQGLVTVHMESLIHDESGGKGAPSPWRHYTIMLTARSDDEILVCRLVVGGTWAIFAKDEPGLIHSANLVVAEKLVHAYLLLRNVSVRPGMYVTGLNLPKDLITAGANIWQFQDKRLVPRWENFPLYDGKILPKRKPRPLDGIPVSIYEAGFEYVSYVVMFNGLNFDAVSCIETATKIAHLIYEAQLEAQLLVQDCVQEVA